MRGFASLEIFGDNGRADSCYQECGHCPIGKQYEAASPMRDFSVMSREGVKRISQYQDAVGEKVESFLVTRGVDAPLDDMEPLPLQASPRIIGFSLGRLPYGDHEEVAKVADKAGALVNRVLGGLSDVLPSDSSELRLSVIPKIENGQLEQLSEVVLFVREMFLKVLNGDVVGCKSNYLRMNFDLNAMPHAQFEDLVDNRVKVYTLLATLDRMANIVLPDTGSDRAYHQSCDILSTADSNMLSLESSIIMKKFELEFSMRLIKASVISGHTPLTRDLGISLLPGHVWASHHTSYVTDSSVRFSYDDLFRMLDLANDSGESVGDILRREILAKR